ncbi:hypothetical protein FHS29_001657 [Saccharothrix tamanrassetensis]|uniref:Ig-like domain-containing protein n=1 Tax=Saccharothrix tamanrassetensis TaxID=1051531 RepID=A0A841CG04_9PSEU|nr:hypothetical protein [Saccharothrix tamanrassetensis]MBB5955087.1 hypothetical protein [Saccharothrix tamanrassetensis]
MRRLGLLRRAQVLTAAVLLTAIPATAGAQPSEEPFTVSFSLTPLEVVPGGKLVASTVASVCKGSGIGPLTSPGFTAPIEWGSRPTGSGDVGAEGEAYGETHAIDTPGTYTATVRCLTKPGVGEVRFTILERQPLRAFTLAPVEVRPGGEITARMPVTNDCTGRTITSSGFVAPIELQTGGGNLPELVGTAEAVATPGTYEATMPCRDGAHVVSFKVLGDPPNDEPPPRQPIKKPKGAPETGAGGTA